MASARKTILIWQSTHSKLKMEAIHQQVTMIELLDAMTDKTIREREATGKLITQENNMKTVTCITCKNLEEGNICIDPGGISAQARIDQSDIDTDRECSNYIPIEEESNPAA